MKPVPIFIITCDRLGVLCSVIDSYTCLDHVEDIIIHDNGSTFPPTICYLERLSRSGFHVYYNQKITRKEDLNSVNITIHRYFNERPPSNYIVTDCDIEITAPKDILRIYSEILEELPSCNVVGPMLDIYDIPDHYPKKTEVTGRHLMQFWNKKVKTVNVSKQIRYIDARIDTTFGMYRAGSNFIRHQLGIRTHAPYIARHLDWYINPNSITPDQLWYAKNCSRDISNWSLL